MADKLLGPNLYSKLIEIKQYLEKYEREIFEENLKVVSLESLLSINYFALGMREILNRSLSRQTKNNNIKTQDWYRTYGYNEKNPDTISSKQKYLYIALDNIFPKDFLFKITDLEEKIEELCKCSMSLNKYVHFSSKQKMTENFDKNKYQEIIMIIYNYFNLVEKTVPDITGNLRDEINSFINEKLYEYFNDNSESFESFDFTDNFGDPKTDLKEIYHLTTEVEDSFLLKIIISGTLDKMEDDKLIIEDAFGFKGEILVTYEKNLENYFISNIDINNLLLNDN